MNIIIESSKNILLNQNKQEIYMEIHLYINYLKKPFSLGILSLYIKNTLMTSSYVSLKNFQILVLLYLTLRDIYLKIRNLISLFLHYIILSLIPSDMKELKPKLEFQIKLYLCSNLNIISVAHLGPKSTLITLSSNLAKLLEF